VAVFRATASGSIYSNIVLAIVNRVAHGLFWNRPWLTHASRSRLLGFVAAKELQYLEDLLPGWGGASFRKGILEEGITEPFLQHFYSSFGTYLAINLKDRPG